MIEEVIMTTKLNKIIILISTFSIVVLSLITYAANPFDDTKAYHSLQQIVTDDTLATLVSVDSDTNGIIDNSDTVDGYDSSVLINEWSPSAPTTGIFYSGGNVGIGTSNPNGNLHIYSASGPYLVLDSDDTPNGYIRKHSSSNSGKLTIASSGNAGSSNGRDITFETYASAQRMVIKANGNVGIGTTSPSQKLDVSGYVKANGFCIGGDCKTAWSQVGSTAPVTCSGSNQALQWTGSAWRCTTLTIQETNYQWVPARYEDHTCSNTDYCTCGSSTTHFNADIGCPLGSTFNHVGSRGWAQGCADGSKFECKGTLVIV